MYSLLVVDDEPAVLALAARLAQAAGYAVNIAGCAGEALDRMAERPSAVVLSDINLPDRSGLWLARQLRQQFPATALVMMSGDGGAQMDAALESGAMASMTKPFSRDILLSILDRARQWHLEKDVGDVWNTARALPGLADPSRDGTD